MKIAVGGDHAGYELKSQVLGWVQAAGHETIDCGTDSTLAVDYPDYSAAVGRKVTSGAADRGIVVCGSGAGAAIAANKIHGVRATLATDTYTAHQCVEHDDVNVLTLGSRVVGVEVAKEIVKAYLSASFTGAERHVRRVGKISSLESKS